MYLRAVHAESNIALLHQFIRENPLGILTTAIKSSLYPLIQSSHIPFVLDVPEPADAESGSASQNDTTTTTTTTSSSYGVLRGHMAKQNPQAKALMDALAASNSPSPSPGLELPDEEVLVLFNAPHHHYVTPKFYTETKPDTGKVVPTWNYSAVQAYGKIKLFCDSKSEETGSFLQTQVEHLSRLAETQIMGYTGEEGNPAPWKVSDAPVSYVETLKKNIIGIEITIERLQGKFKMSQEMKPGDRQGVIEGFETLRSDVGSEIAHSVRQRAALLKRDT